MGLLGRKERRVPDLSRYDYHYQNKPAVDSSKYYVPRDMATKRLSASAAAAAIYTNPNPNATGVNRSYSMMHSYAPVSSINNNSGRTYSLQSNRTASITSNTRRPVNRTVVKKKTVKKGQNGAGEIGTGVNQSRTNSITVRTTKVKDPQGRTKSITRKTIRRINGYEVVETTTTTTDVNPIDGVTPPLESNDIDVDEDMDEDVHNNQTHFDEFSGDFVEDDMSIDQQSGQVPMHHQQQQQPYIEEIVEEEYEEPPKMVTKRANSLTSKENTPPNMARRALGDGETPLDQTSSISNFKDAMEYLPPAPKPNTKPVTRTKSSLKNPSSLRQGTTNQRRTVSFTNESIAQKKKAQTKPKQPLTEQEMYLQALEVAKKKVYKTDDVVIANGAANGDVKRVSTMGKRMTLRDTPATKIPRSSSTMMNNFHGTGNQGSNTATPRKTTEAKRTKSMTSTIGRPAETRKKLTDEEMYEKALEIAQKRYNESIALESVNSGSVPSGNTTTAQANIPPKKSSFKDRFVKTFQHEDKMKTNDEGQDGNNAVDINAVSVDPVVSTMENEVITEVRPGVTLKKDINVPLANTVPVGATTNATAATSTPLAKNISHPVSGTYSSISNDASGSGARKFSSSQFSDEQYASAYAPMDSKPKNKFVNKILKFAQQNSGIRVQGDEDEAAAMAAMQPSAPANIVPVQRRSSVTKLHGAATTLPVDAPLPDNESVSSFRHTHEKIEKPMSLDAIERKLSHHTAQGVAMTPPVAPVAATDVVEPLTPEATKVPTVENVVIPNHMNTQSGMKTPFIDIDAVDARSGHIPFDESQISNPDVARVSSNAPSSQTKATRSVSTSTGTTEKKKQSFLQRLFKRK
ncbi:Meiotic sister-chromatid recombination protein 3 [Nakaseomyces bracarensis]|uniref:Meiotic sister-chromatid recombination protein 3 n=1 Tax=Nakaseomyces bracarensis TaxID=273131 RepID=A0ABR4NTR6_9SACH